MTIHSGFISRLTDATRSVSNSLVELGLRTWPPSGAHVTTDDGLIHLFYVLDGILTCKRSTHLSRVLPREVLRIGGADERVLDNPSRSDSALAIHVTLAPDDSTPLSTRHHYFSDDQKDNKLCHIAARERNGRTLATGAPLDLYLTTLGRYETVLLDRADDQPLLIQCISGEATINGTPANLDTQSIEIDGPTATITGSRHCTVLIIRGQASDVG
ncbi:MAG: hypothetical protein AAF465_11560 [Pseudomonadota bacterium]